MTDPNRTGLNVVSTSMLVHVHSAMEITAIPVPATSSAILAFRTGAISGETVQFGATREELLAMLDVARAAVEALPGVPAAAEGVAA